MNRRIFLSLFSLTLGAGFAEADIVSYAVKVDTSGFALSGGFIEFQFNQANSVTSGVGTARIYDFTSTGYGLGGEYTGIGALPGATGSLAAPPLIIRNDVGAANGYDEIVNTWGQGFRFLVDLNTAATDSGLFVFLLDSGFNPIVAPLGSGEVANLLIDSNGVVTPNGSPVATVNAVPEPGFFPLLAVSILAMVALRAGMRVRKAAGTSAR